MQIMVHALGDVLSSIGSGRSYASRCKDVARERSEIAMIGALRLGYHRLGKHSKICA